MHRVKWGFILILILTLLPLVIFPLRSTFFHQITQSPAVTDGVLNLNGYDVTRGRGIPLDGDWAFYKDQRIVTDGAASASPDFMAAVPRPWVRYRPDGEPIESRGVGSYRITLKNCPGDVALMCYIPNISTYYRVFLDGLLIAGADGLDGSNSPEHSRVAYAMMGKPDRMGVCVPAGSDAELVIEISSLYIGGLYMTPILTCARADHIHSDIRNFLSSALMGVLIVTIGCIAILFFSKDKSFSTLALLLMDLLMLLRILFQFGYLDFLKNHVRIRGYAGNTILQIVTLFLPVIFLFCAHQLVRIEINKNFPLFTVLYEMVFSAFILWCALAGHPRFLLFFCVISYIPFVFVLHKLYKSVKQGIPHALTVSTILFLILASTVGTTLCRSGILVMDVTLFPLVCFASSMLLQLGLYIKKNIEIQKEAMEAENLRLRLKENETDLMLSQIKPHFLYNTLIAIHMLCTEEPETAAETVLKFAAFLRTNMNFISSRKPIPFAQELSHIKNYADIEKLRFQKRLELLYDIRTTSFTVPPLSIQPLVENAIRHGACKNVRGGVVLLKTDETADGYLIEIVDDGPGFDPKTLETAGDEPHGIRNITLRLERQMGAKVKIITGSGEGTTVQIVLPKEGAYESNFSG